jgi:hypothetical protein
MTQIAIDKLPELDITSSDLETAGVLYFRELLLKLKEEYHTEITNNS